MRHCHCGLLLIVLVHGAAAIAQKPPPACSLLQASEIDKVLGIKVRPGEETDTVIPNGPAKGQTMTSCTWGIGERGMVGVGAIPARSDAQREGALGVFHQGSESLKAQGWKIEMTVIGGIDCGTMVPPPKDSEHLPVGVGCTGVVKGMALTVNSMIAKTQVPLDKAKALFDAAVARLP